MIDWTQFPPALPLEQIFLIEDPSKLDHELGHHCFLKKIRYSQALTQAEHVYEGLSRMGGEIAGDGFLSLFNQVYGPEDFSQICNALTDVGGNKLRDLLREAWNIYTRGKEGITVDELQSISVMGFNTRKRMDRFDAIGEEVVKEIHEQHDTGKVWSVEYAKRHRSEFLPIEGQIMTPSPKELKALPPLPSVAVETTPPPLPYLVGHKFRNPIFRQVKHPNDIFAMKSEHLFVMTLALHGTLKQHELGSTLNETERAFQLLTAVAGECYDSPVEKWLSKWATHDLEITVNALKEGGAVRVMELIEKAQELLQQAPLDSKLLSKVSKELHGAEVAAELHKAQVTYARGHQAEFVPVP